MNRKYMYLAIVIAALLFSCADKSSPEYAVKTLIDAVKNHDEKLISDMIDYDRILVSVKKEEYVLMLPEQKMAEIDKLNAAMLESFSSGKLSVLKDISPMVESVDIVDEEFGPKARVIIGDKKSGGDKFDFRLSKVDELWKVVYISRIPA